MRIPAVLAALALTAGLAACSSAPHQNVRQPESIPKELPDHGTSDTGTFEKITLPSGRIFWAHVPFSYNPARPLPVIMAFHGYNNNEASMFSTHLPRANAVTLFMSGKGDAWAPAPYAETSREEDLAYVDQALAHAKESFATNGKVYATGFSNGGGFVHMLACQRPNTFTAMATVAAANYEAVDTRCSDQAIPYLSIHGTDDGLMKYYGGSAHGEDYESVKEVMTRVARDNGCNNLPDNRKELPNVIHTTWNVCDARTEHYRINHGTHTWQGGATDKTDTVPKGWTSSVILDFFGVQKMNPVAKASV